MDNNETEQNIETKSSGNPMVMVAVLVVLALVGGMWFMTNKKTETTESTESTSVLGKETDAEVKNESNLPQPSVEVKSYTLTEVAGHGNADDCWMAVDGKVYDVTNFISKHPGGKSIVGGCGLDASKLFNERPTNSKGPHPENALEMLKTLYIGDLKTD